MKTFTLSAASLALGLGLAAGAAQAWPTKPLTIVVPYPPGGMTDVVTRVIGEQLAVELKTSVVVDNRPGAGGKIGLDQVRRGPKDGHTIALVVPATMVTLPLTDPNYNLKPLQDFEPITIAIDTFTVMVASPKAVPAGGGLKDLVAKAKANPGKLNYATPGAGTSFHFNTVILNGKLGIDAVHVPYKGETGALNDLAGGAIDYMLASQGAKTYVDGGRIVPLAVTSDKRVAPYPNVPTFNELGIDFRSEGWVGYAAPAGVPAPVMKQLQTAFQRALQAPTVRKSIEDMGMEVVGSTPQAFRDSVSKMSQRYSAMLQSGSVKITP